MFSIRLWSDYINDWLDLTTCNYDKRNYSDNSSVIQLSMHCRNICLTAAIHNGYGFLQQEITTNGFIMWFYL